MSIAGSPSVDEAPASPMRNPGFRALMAYRICTILSYQIVAVTVGWHVYEITRSPFALGLIGLAEVLPYFCIAPFAGYLVDHLPRRKLGVAACAGLLVTSLALVAIVQGWLSFEGVWPIYVAIALTGIARSFLGPVYNALFARVLPRVQFVRGASLGSIVFQSGMVVGPALGGVLVGWGGKGMAYGTAACIVIVAAVAIGTLRVTEPPQLLQRVVVDGKLVTHSLVDINLGIRILLGHSFYDDWAKEETFVKQDPLGNPVDQRHPWNQTTIPRPQKRDFDGAYSWTMSPRWFDGKDYLALDTGGGPLARFWATALAGMVDIGYVKATGSSVKMYLPKTATKPETEFEWKIPKWSNTIERDRARTYFQVYACAAAYHFVEKALAELHAGRTRTWNEFTVPEEAISCGFHEAVRGVLSHHVVIRNGKIANYHPYPPTPWNASVRDVYGTPGPYEDAVQNTPIFEENGPDDFKGIDIMRSVRSFDPCLPCGVHMYLGNGKVVETHHSPFFGNR